MIRLSELKNTHRKKVKRMRVGRGLGSGKGKTCGRGTKGDKARSGYTRRHGNEGGQLPMFKRVPIRGFTRGRFEKEQDSFAINVGILEKFFNSGEVVNYQSLVEKRFISRKKSPRIKILGQGELTKALVLEVHEISAGAKEKIEKVKGTLKLIQA